MHLDLDALLPELLGKRLPSYARPTTNSFFAIISGALFGWSSFTALPALFMNSVPISRTIAVVRTLASWRLMTSIMSKLEDGTGSSIFGRVLALT